jgi:hypothetical protein
MLSIYAVKCSNCPPDGRQLYTEQQVLSMLSTRDMKTSLIRSTREGSLTVSAAGEGVRYRPTVKISIKTDLACVDAVIR